MSSGEILARIQQREAELEELRENKKSVDTISDSMSCLSEKFSKAAALVAGDVCTVGGVSFDNNKTEERSVEIKNSVSKVEGLSNDIVARMTALEREISALWAEYYVALAREAAEAAAEEEARVNKLTVMEEKLG